MPKYQIGEVEKLTGVKASILRSWEHLMPFIEPVKDLRGRRSYSQHDVEVIFRLKHLILEKGYTVEAARKKIIADALTMEANAAAIETLHEIREQLGEMYLMLKKSGENYNRRLQAEKRQQETHNDRQD